MKRREEVLEQLATIVDPDLKRDLVSLGFVRELSVTEAGAVAVTLELTTPACPLKQHFREMAEARVGALPWVASVTVTMTVRGPGLKPAGPGLARVRRVLAVASCKGGVGKSTVAVNLAVALTARGLAVGLFDADLYGPSLPTMCRAERPQVEQKPDGMLLPVAVHGMVTMSFAYVAPPGNGPAMLRGPKVSGIVNRLLTGTAWGALDVLVVDMPPGTGDVQLTLAQLGALSAAVMVTTPHPLSLVDVEKGLAMFDRLGVPTVAVVENMARFVCGECGAERRLFGGGAVRELAERFGVGAVVSLPVDAALAESGGAGVPLGIAAPESASARVMDALAAAVLEAAERLPKRCRVRCAGGCPER